MIIRRSEKYDAYYYEESREWIEMKCRHLNCEICKDRPDKAPVDAADKTIGKTKKQYEPNI